MKDSPETGAKRPPLLLYTDGASRGNPGRAGAGIRILDPEGTVLLETDRYLGQKTNNEAEYWALILGLNEAKRLGGDGVRAFTDSELVAKQVTGVYRVKHENLKGLHRSVLERARDFSSFEITAIPRERNAEADRLANRAIDRRIEQEKKGIP